MRTGLMKIEIFLKSPTQYVNLLNDWLKFLAKNKGKRLTAIPFVITNFTKQ